MRTPHLPAALLLLSFLGCASSHVCNSRHWNKTAACCTDSPLHAAAVCPPRIDPAQDDCAACTSQSSPNGGELNATCFDPTTQRCCAGYNGRICGSKEICCAGDLELEAKCCEEAQTCVLNAHRSRCCPEHTFGCTNPASGTGEAIHCCDAETELCCHGSSALATYSYWGCLNKSTEQCCLEQGGQFAFKCGATEECCSGHCCDPETEVCERNAGGVGKCTSSKTGSPNNTRAL